MDNLEVVRRVEEAYGAKDYGTIRALIAPAFRAHTPGSDALPAGVEGCIAANETGFTSFPDKRTEILDIFGENDLVVARVRMTGTNDGGLTWANVPPNGAEIDTEWIQISRHDAQGRILETWAQMNVLKMMGQLGVVGEGR